ncbi:MAG TPA: VWA domain-containing protein [Anaerolineales bacterium]|nr:VWA domain-containing protein [Anaerolineales bacterium]
MDLLWPGFLLLLGLIPVLIVIYILILRRRRRFAVRYSSLSLVREAMSRQSWLRRHLPFILFLFALTSLIVALTRPVTIVTVPSGQTTIMLAIDVSGSMCSTDISPSRIEAAEAAAISFIRSQQSKTQIGVVAFSGFAELVQPPTNDQEVLQDAVQSLLVGRRTAIGSGILAALDAIAGIDKSVAPSDESLPPGVKPTPVAKGAYAPDIIVLLTDGVSNAGPLPLDAAQEAAVRGVRVYTIGFGTSNPPNGTFGNCGRFQGSEPFGGGGFGGFGGGGGFFFGGGGGGFRRGIDEDTLKQIADMTGGKYYAAESASELNRVFQSLPTYLIAKHETTEVSFIFVALGAFFALIAMALSILWHPLS